MSAPRVYDGAGAAVTVDLSRRIIDVIVASDQMAGLHVVIYDEIVGLGIVKHDARLDDVIDHDLAVEKLPGQVGRHYTMIDKC